MTFKQKHQYRRYKKAVGNINQRFVSQMNHICHVNVELDKNKDDSVTLRIEDKDFSYETYLNLNTKIKVKDIEDYIYDIILGLG